MKVVNVERLLARLRRRGVVVRLDGGRVRVSGWRRLDAAEREELRRLRDQVREVFERRARRQARAAERQRQREQQEQEQAVQPVRRQVGVTVLGPGLTRPLYADEVVAPFGRGITARYRLARHLSERQRV